MLLCINFNPCSCKGVLKIFTCTIRFCLSFSVMFLWFSIICRPTVVTPLDFFITLVILISIIYDRLSGTKVSKECHSQFTASAHFRIGICCCCDRHFSVFLVNCHQSVFIYGCDACIKRSPCNTLVFCIFRCYFCLHLYSAFFSDRCNSGNCRYFYFLRQCDRIIQNIQSIQFYFCTRTCIYFFIEHFQL